MKQALPNRSYSHHYCIRLLFSLIILLSLQQATYSQVSNVHAEAQEKLDKTSELFHNGQLDSMLIEANILNEFSKTHQLLSFQAQSNYYLGRYYLSIGNMDSSIYYLKAGELQFCQLVDTLNIGKTNFLIGVNYTYLAETDTSLFYYDRGGQWLSYTNDSVWNSVINNYISVTYFELGNYSKALVYSQLSLNYLKNSTDTISIGGIYNTMGNIYRKMREVEKEKQSYINAIKILEDIPKTHHLGMAYNNLAEVYLNQQEIELGLKTLEKAKECYETIDYTLGMCGYYSVLSLFYSNTEPPQYEKVIEYSTKSIKIAEQFNDNRQLADATSFLGNALLNTRHFNKAEQILLKGYKIADQNMLTNELLKISLVLSQVYEKKQQSDKALLYLKINNQYKDSLFNEEKIKEFTSLDLQYQFKQEQLRDSLKNEIVNAKIQLAHKTEIKTQKAYFKFSIIISILLIAFAVYFYYSSKRRKTANHLLRIQNQKIGEQNLEIEKNAAQIQKAFKELQELDEFKQTFTSMLVHDLKNPLNILVNIEEFETETERLELVKYSSHNMLNLVMNMLDINRAETEKIRLDLTETTIIETLQEAIDITSYLSKNKEIEIKIIHDKDYKIKADESLLIRVFTNLLTNAIKFSPSQNIIQIKISVSDSNKLYISIIDNGPGIAKEYQQLIFEKFKQVKTVKSGSIGSTGLGLAFCKLAIEAHQWEIGVESQEGHGADFWIKIDAFSQAENLDHFPYIPNEDSYKTLRYSISKEDLVTLKPYLWQLEKLQVSAVTDVKKIVSLIKTENIEGLNDWLEHLLNAVSSYNEEKFINLIKSLLI